LESASILDTILIVGMGGLGVPAACALARGGAKRLGLADPDPVELSNLPRQVIYTTRDIGRRKVDSAAAYLLALRPDLVIHSYPFALDESNAAHLIAAHGFVIDATDDPAAKFLINDTCVALGRPFVYAGVVGTSGQAMTVLPGRTACLRCLFEGPPAADETASCREAGILGSVAAVIGEIEAAEAICAARGDTPQLAGRILTYRAAPSAQIRVLEVKARSGCGCGAAKRRTRGGRRAGAPSLRHQPREMR
jgi:molybdopterin/thiamine biosynthesis adenylyltransferase